MCLLLQEWDEEFKEHELNLKAIKQKGQDLMNDQHPGTAAIAVIFRMRIFLALFLFYSVSVDLGELEKCLALLKFID